MAPRELDDDRFLAVLNEAAERCGPDWSAPGSATDPRALAWWAAFLKACVQGGVSVGDPRWRRLEVVRVGPRSRFRLAGGAPSAPPDSDFRLGLALLMGLLDESVDHEGTDS
jgi:hypothetical protein